MAGHLIFLPGSVTNFLSDPEQDNSFPQTSVSLSAVMVIYLGRENSRVNLLIVKNHLKILDLENTKYYFY